MYHSNPDIHTHYSYIAAVAMPKSHKVETRKRTVCAMKQKSVRNPSWPSIHGAINQGRDRKDLHSFPLLPHSLCNSVLCTLTVIDILTYPLRTCNWKICTRLSFRMPVEGPGSPQNRTNCSRMYPQLHSSAPSGSNDGHLFPPTKHKSANLKRQAPI
jgi:hypothetical protein